LELSNTVLERGIFGQIKTFRILEMEENHERRICKAIEVVYVDTNIFGKDRELKNFVFNLDNSKHRSRSTRTC
jgi:hypothetical protein